MIPITHNRRQIQLPMVDTIIIEKTRKANLRAILALTDAKGKMSFLRQSSVRSGKYISRILITQRGTSK
jgi:hypothetical protein